MVAVTGGTGHLGNVVIRKLIDGGCAVSALVRSPAASARLLRTPNRVARGDLADPEALDRCFSGCRSVIHAAAMVSTDDRDARRLREVNVEGTRAVVEACLRNGVERLVSIGSIEAFPLGRSRVTDGSGPTVDEASMAKDGPAIPPLQYGLTKAQSARIVLEASTERLEAIVLSPTAIVGPYDVRPSYFGRVVQAFLAVGIPAYIRGGFDFVDVRDVATACVAALDRGRRGAHYVLSGSYVTVRELLALLADYTGKAAPPIRVPVWTAVFAAWTYLKTSHLLGRSTAFTPATVRLLETGVRASSVRAEREFGYSSRPISETVRDTVAWFTGERG